MVEMAGKDRKMGTIPEGFDWGGCLASFEPLLLRFLMPFQAAAMVRSECN